MKIRPPLKVERERENDLHMPPANSTSKKVNNVEEKTFAKTELQIPPL